MAENKTQPTTASVTAFIDAIEDPQQKKDARKVASMMRKATGKRAKMWGPSMVGYGSYHYRYASGREGDFMITGFAPRKNMLSLYIMPGYGRFDALMKNLGKFKTGKACLYIKRLSDVDEDVLQNLIDKSVEYMRANYETK